MKKTSPYMGTVPGPRRRLYNREEGGNDRGVQRGQGVSSHLPKMILKIILATAILFIVIFLLFIIIQRNTNPEHGGRALGPNHSIGSLIGDSHLEDKVKQFKTKKDCRRSVGRGLLVEEMMILKVENSKPGKILEEGIDNTG